MTASAFQGPLAVFGRASTSDTNPHRAPSLFDEGVALLDPRPPFTYRPGGSGPMYGWLGATRVCVINQVPSAISATNIAAAQVPVAATPLTLTAGTGITSGVSIVRADTGATVAGLFAIDSAMGAVSPSSNGPVRLWDPTKAIARNLRITSVGDDSGATFTIAGYDLYGYPLTQVVTGANAGVAATAKAFKYVASVTPAGTLSGSNVSLGTGDAIGLPLRADFVGETQIVYDNALITAATGFTAAVTTDPSTTTTGDVRGTYALQTASNGTRRLIVYVSPSVANIITTTGLFGVTQV